MSDLRERVARAKYEEKRARLLEAFGDTSGWPEWEALRVGLKEIEMEECDFYIALVLEEAARVVVENYQELCAEHRLLLLNRANAIRALKSGGATPSQSDG